MLWCGPKQKQNSDRRRTFPFSSYIHISHLPVIAVACDSCPMKLKLFGAPKLIGFLGTNHQSRGDINLLLFCHPTIVLKYQKYCIRTIRIVKTVSVQQRIRTLVANLCRFVMIIFVYCDSFHNFKYNYVIKAMFSHSFGIMWYIYMCLLSSYHLRKRTKQILWPC